MTHLKPRAHFLHIGKTGGTALKQALEAHLHDGKYDIALHSHETKLQHVPMGEKVFFVLRHPVTRFVSGFYSRMRQGLPRYHYPWSEQEKHAFARFTTANELAEALSSCDVARRRDAQRAMSGIQHVRESVWHWFRKPDYFSSRAGDLLFVGFQESLDADFQVLTKLLELDGNIRLSTDCIEMHKTPAAFDRTVSELGRQNLLAHYANDVRFYEELRTRTHATKSSAISS